MRASVSGRGMPMASGSVNSVPGKTLAELTIIYW